MNRNISDAATLYLRPGAALFIGSIFDTEVHQHHAAQITFGVDAPLLLELDGREVECRAAFLPSNLPHRLRGTTGIQAVLLVEPESAPGQFLRVPRFHDFTSLDLPADFYTRLAQAVSTGMVRIENLIAAIRQFGQLPVARADLDERLVRVLTLIDTSTEKKVAVRSLAARVLLSESHLQHLFKEQVGIPIKRYLLWKRLIDGIHLAATNHDLTGAAHQAGFADSAHMSRTFKAMFGVKPSELFTKSRSVQVIVENSR